MSMWARLKAIAGGDRELFTQTAAATCAVPDHTNLVSFDNTSAVTITSLTSSASTRNRLVFFQNLGTANVTFTNTNTPTTAGQMYMGGVDVILETNDIIALFLRADGTWARLRPIA